MWFKRSKPGPEPDPRLDEVIATVAQMQQDVRTIQMEWEDWFEKFRNLYARINKRVQRESAASQPNGADKTQPPMNPLAARLLSQGGRE